MRKISGDTFALHCRGTGTEQQMTVYAVMPAAQIPWGNLARHVQGNPAFQPKHHFRVGAVQVVNHVQMQTLFQNSRQPQHPLF